MPKHSKKLLSKIATLSRRQLLAGLGGGALLGSGLGAVACDYKETSSIVWDKTTDVLVLGSGTGLVAALAARASGKDVMVLEKRAVTGGNTGISGGVAWIPNNNLMREAGIKDSYDMAMRYVRMNSGGQAEEFLLDAFVRNGLKMADFVENHTDLKWRLSRILPRVSDYHPEWEGSVIWGRSIEPDVQGGWLLGGHLIAHLLAGVQKANIPIMTSTRALRLITRRSSPTAPPEVLGVQAEHKGRIINIRTVYGVHMATGGFEHNPELKRHFLRGPSPYSFGVSSNTGDGLRMAMAAGADLRNMNESWSISVFKPEGERASSGGEAMTFMAQIEKRGAGSITVNRYGQRFSNEAGSYDAGWRSYLMGENWGDLAYRNLPAWQLYDHKMRANKTVAGRVAAQPLPDWVVQADTLEELASRLGIDPKGLLKTVTTFNENARNGVDPDFHRGESAFDRTDSDDPKNASAEVTLAPLDKPPFYGVEVSPADTGTCGGARVNANAQVLDPFDIPIKRLYASGNCAGIGGPGVGYAGGGGTIGPAMTFAYIGARHLSSLKPIT